MSLSRKNVRSCGAPPRARFVLLSAVCCVPSATRRSEHRYLHPYFIWLPLFTYGDFDVICLTAVCGHIIVPGKKYFNRMKNRDAHWVLSLGSYIVKTTHMYYHCQYELPLPIHILLPTCYTICSKEDSTAVANTSRSRMFVTDVDLFALLDGRRRTLQASRRTVYCMLPGAEQS